MARRDLVPALGNTLEVVAALTPEELARCWVWVATPGHVERAAEAGARRLPVLPVRLRRPQPGQHRATHRDQPGRDARGGRRRRRGAVEDPAVSGDRVHLPLRRRRRPRRRTPDRARPPPTAPPTSCICDTLGQAIPADVAELVGRVRRKTDDDGSSTAMTPGAGRRQHVAAVHAGAVEVDGALGGLGGCPFAPGAGGNTSSEDLLFALRPPWLTP